MKSKSSILLFLSIFIFHLSFSSCEVIHEADRLIPVPLPQTGGRRHVLLEYTGFRCVNCPDAAEQAAALKSLYGDRLILISLHPASNPFTQGLYDYTCPEADSIYRFMGGTATTSFPKGNIDMQRTESGYFIEPLNWPAQLNTAMTDTLWDPETPHDTSYWLVEDSVLGVQAMPDGSVNMAYYHRHVLRAISHEPFTQLPAQCDPAQCSVVTIYTDINNKQILQAYENPYDLSPHP